MDEQRDAVSTRSICVGCGICCDGTLFRSVSLQDDEDPTPLEQVGVRFIRRAGQRAFAQPCPGSQAGSCTIYEIRPHSCRVYVCDVFRRQQAGEWSSDDARTLIALTLDLRDRLKPALAPFLMGAERAPLEELYSVLLAKFEPASVFARRVDRSSAGGPPTEEISDVLLLRDLRYRMPDVGLDLGTDAGFDVPGLALEAAGELLETRLRELGPDDPDILRIRDLVAAWTGLSGRPLEALELHRMLLEDRLRVLGPDHPETLASRHEVADWTGVCGDPQGALELHRDLLPDRTAVLGPDHPNTLNTRHSIAYWTGASAEGGSHAGMARRLYADLLADRTSLAGADDPDTLSTRYSLAYWTGMDGDPHEALNLSGELLFDCIRVLGADHPDTRVAGRSVAYWSRLESPTVR